MGLLDDAIREHLELKRLRGADPSEVAREEQEALAPVPRSPEGRAVVHDDHDDRDEEHDEDDDAFSHKEDLAASRRMMDGQGHADIGQETAELDMQMVLDGDTAHPIRAARSDAKDEPFEDELPGEDESPGGDRPKSQ